MPPSRCSVTISGLRSHVTVSIPRIPWATTMTSNNVVRRTGSRPSRRCTQASAVINTTIRPSVLAA
jgi:hypothetical protein